MIGISWPQVPTTMDMISKGSAVVRTIAACIIIAAAIAPVYEHHSGGRSVITAPAAADLTIITHVNSSAQTNISANANSTALKLQTLRTRNGTLIGAPVRSNPLKYPHFIDVSEGLAGADCWSDERYQTWSKAIYSPSHCDQHLSLSLANIVFHVLTVKPSHISRGDLWMCTSGQDLPFGHLYFHTNSYESTSRLPLGIVRESDDSKQHVEFRYNAANKLGMQQAASDPNVLWMTLWDDDCMIFPRTLLNALDQYDPHTPYFIGELYPVDGTTRLAGGGGYAISKAAAALILPIIDQCMHYKNHETNDGFHSQLAAFYFQRNKGDNTPVTARLGAAPMLSAHYIHDWVERLRMYRLYESFAWC